MHLGDQTHVQLPSCRARYPYRTWTPSYAKHSCDLLYYHYSLSLTTSLTFTLQWRSFTRYFTISPLPPHAAAITGVHPYFSIQKRRGNSRVLALVEVCFVVQQQLVLSFKLVSCIFAAKTILDHSLTSTVHSIQSLQCLATKKSSYSEVIVVITQCTSMQSISHTVQPLEEQIIAVIS